MNVPNKVNILYFTDILCIWAYLAQIRMDKLLETFTDTIDVQHHFIPVFGAVKEKMHENWGDQGGVSAYSAHIQQIAKTYDHIEVHPDLWMKHTPTTSISCHLFLKAVQILIEQEEISSTAHSRHPKQNLIEALSWEFRRAFFQDLINVSDIKAQREIAEKFQLPLQKIQQLFDNGEAFAALDRDLQLKEKYAVSGSPTLVLNQGRQIIYGNVGYRVIEANIQELLSQPDEQASWC